MPDASVVERLNAALSDRYRIERDIGSGGMAMVYLAEDLKHKRKVALKVLKPELAAVIGASRFLAEISTTANLQHPHLLPLHDSGQVDGTAYYVMPFVEGESLRDRLSRERQLPVNDAVRIATEVAGALDYAHRKGVIHRDIKPENILLHDGRALVADFGIALAASKSDGSSRLTETGMSLGTPHYMSPEQAMGERTLDGRTDIYALGCVLYEMLSGEPPFQGPTAQAIVAKVMSSDPVPVEELRRSVPEHVAAAVHVALQKVPADRFLTAADLASAIQDPTRPRTLVRGRSASPRRSRWLSLAPWGLAVAAIALLAISLSGDDSSTGSTRPVRFSFPVVAAAGLRDRPAISPDGRFIVYNVSEVGGTRLYRRFLDESESTPLAGTEGAARPAISPDGRWLAYVGRDFSVYKRSFDGGRPIKVLDTSSPPNGIAWSRKHGLVTGMLAMTPDSGLVIAGDTAGSTPRTMTASGKSMHHDPFIPADGDFALFQDTDDFALGVAHLPDGKVNLLDVRVDKIVGYAKGVLLYIDPRGALMAVGFNPRTGALTSQPVPVNGSPQGLRSAAMSADGTLVMQVENEVFRVQLVDERGVGSTLVPDTLDDVHVRYSPDGTRIALVMTGPNSSGLRVYDLRTSTLSTVVSLNEFYRVEWTPDGKRLLLAAFGASSVYWLAADGSDTASVLYELPDSVKTFSTSFAANGRELILGTHLGTGAANISRVQLDGDSVLTPVVATEANEVAPRLSPDGRWLAYASDESGRYEVYVRAYPSAGAREQLSFDGGSQPIWSRDGRRLFYRIGDAFMSVDTDPDQRSGRLQASNRRKLFEGPFLGNDPTRIVALYDVAPDGRHFVAARALEGSRSEIVVWVNWIDELAAQIRGLRK